MKYLFALAAVVAVAVLGGVAGCGGGERLSRQEFSDRLQTIDERGSELYGRLAKGAQDLNPEQPLPADVKEALMELVEFQQQAAAELEALNLPEGAEEPVAMLIEALRKRTETFTKVIEAGRFTREDFAQVMQSGERTDQSFARLRDGGFLPPAEEHEEE